MSHQLVKAIEKQYLRTDLGDFAIGDTVDVATRIIEGEKERVQVFTGTVIARKGSGINETFIVRRIVNNEGVERIFPRHSPFIAKITVRRSGVSRRAKLYYLRDRVGKGVRLTEKRRDKREQAQPEAAPSGELATAAAG